MKSYQKLLLGLTAIVSSSQMNAQQVTETKNYKRADKVKISYADINGDGYVDKISDVRIAGPPTRTKTYTYLNDKKGSFENKLYSINTMQNYKKADEVNITYKDMNGNGFADQIVDVRIVSLTKTKTFVYLNDKKGNFLKKRN